MLDFKDPLPVTRSRVLVAGVTGVGKSTLARRLARRWDLPYTELDALHHGPNWSIRPTFVSDVAALAATERWITEWQYSAVRPLLGERAEAVVWLDLPRRIALPRLLRRTVRRRIRREVLWNGNVEPPLHSFLTAPETNILRWEMRTHARWRVEMPRIEHEYPHLAIVRLRHPREVDFWLRGPAG